MREGAKGGGTKVTTGGGLFLEFALREGADLTLPARPVFALLPRGPLEKMLWADISKVTWGCEGACVNCKEIRYRGSSDEAK